MRGFNEFDKVMFKKYRQAILAKFMSDEKIADQLINIVDQKIANASTNEEKQKYFNLKEELLSLKK